MRNLLLAVLLFQGVNAFGQNISAEISSGPLPFTKIASFLPAPAVQMAKDRTGVAIVWVMPTDLGDRISVVRLDGTGHFTGFPSFHPNPFTSSGLRSLPSRAATASQSRGSKSFPRRRRSHAPCTAGSIAI